MGRFFPEIQDLEALIGFENWDLITRENTFFVLTPELFDSGVVEKSLALSGRMAGMLIQF